MAAPRRVIVCGAGVIGASIAYFLARRGVAITVPGAPEEVEVSDAGCQTLARAAGRVSSALAGARIGRIPGLTGACVATGHGRWGMLNAPATGLGLAELILDGAPSVLDLGPFDPARLPAARRPRPA